MSQTFEDMLEAFLKESRENRDYHNQTAAIMKKVVKSASDLKNGLEKINEINHQYNKQGEK